jgi:hypothetical protein
MSVVDRSSEAQIRSDSAAEKAWAERTSRARPRVVESAPPPAAPLDPAETPLVAGNIFTIANDAKTDTLPEPFRPWRAAPISLGAAWVLTETINESLQDGHRAIASEIDELRAELTEFKVANAELKAELSEVRARLAETPAKASESSFIIARLRLDHKGDVGPEGKMGRDGAPGPAGPRGEQGPPGNRGAMGRTPTSWEISPRDWTATIVFENGELGPVLNLHPFFAEYDESVGNTEEISVYEMETERAMAERAKAELELVKLRR